MRALVLSGGGIKGAFQVGVLMGLKDTQGFDLITGSSVGAINAAYLAQYKKEEFDLGVMRLAEMWRTALGYAESVWSKRFPFGIPGLWKRSIGKQSGLKHLVKNYIDLDKLQSSYVELSIPAADLVTGEIEHFRKDMPKYLKRAIVASATIPIAMEPVEILGGLYVDAGVREMAPLKEAIRRGATEIVLITTQPLDTMEIIKKDKFKDTFDVGARVLSMSLSEIIRNDICKCRTINEKVATGTGKLKRYINLTVINPRRALKSSMNFELDLIESHIQTGIDTGRMKRNG